MSQRQDSFGLISLRVLGTAFSHCSRFRRLLVAFSRIARHSDTELDKVGGTAAEPRYSPVFARRFQASLQHKAAERLGQPSIMPKALRANIISRFGCFCG